MSEWGILAPIGNATAHFTWRELACRHCGEIHSVETALALAEFLEGIRLHFEHKFGYPVAFHIDSAHRCPEHNAAIGGAGGSYHVKGMAADITLRDVTPHQVWSICRDLQREGRVGGLGRYAGFTHIDHGPARNWEG